MKKLAILLLTGFCIQAKAQNPANLASDAPQYFEFYDMTGKRIPNGEMTDVNGTSLLHQEWGKASIVLANGKQFADTGINYSLLENKVFFRRAGGVYVIPSPVKEFIITYKNNDGTEDKSHFRSGYPAIDRRDSSALYEVLYEGSAMQLLKFQHKKVEEVYTYGGPVARQFALDEYYYVYLSQEGKMIPVKADIHSFKKGLPAYSSEISNYANTHKIAGNNEDQFVSLIAFLDKKK
jgi:hypothetical protein